jgi:hypothetical protein
MSTFEKIPVSVCAVRLISSLQADFKAELKLDDSVFSLGIFTADSDDVAYIAADEATKQANVRVVYGSSFYAGAKHGPSSTAGEVILMLAGPSPAEVRSGAGRGAERGARWRGVSVGQRCPHRGLFVSCGDTLRVVSGRGGRRQGRRFIGLPGGTSAGGRRGSGRRTQSRRSAAGRLCAPTVAHQLFRCLPARFTSRLPRRL